MGNVTILKSEDSNPKNTLLLERTIKANKLMAVASAVLFVLSLLILIFTFSRSAYYGNIVACRILWSISLGSNALILIVAFLVKFKKKFLKYISISIFIFDIFVTSIAFSSYGAFFIVPLVLSICYFDKRYSLVIAIISFLVSTAADLINNAFLIGLINLDSLILTEPIIIDPVKTLTRDQIIPYLDVPATLRHYAIYFLPLKFILYGSITYLFLFFTNFTEKLALQHAKTIEKDNMIQADLDTASRIQRSMLPKEFDKANKNPHISLAARAFLAKEVGGDFYDFFKINENKFAFLIADVSGKGIPAALFMANSKTTIKDCVLSNPSLSDALTEANKILCKSNYENLFVTIWIGVLDLTNGHLSYINAGHNPPLYIKNDNEVYFLKTKAQRFVCAYEDSVFKENELVLNQNDTIFLYTDGVTEALNDSNEFFGENRLLDVASTTKNENLNFFLTNIKFKVDEFSKGSELSDDLTMLAIKYKG